MRTDSVTLSDQALDGAAAAIANNYGDNTVSAGFSQIKTQAHKRLTRLLTHGLQPN